MFVNQIQVTFGGGFKCYSNQIQINVNLDALDFKVSSVSEQCCFQIDKEDNNF